MTDKERVINSISIALQKGYISKSDLSTLINDDKKSKTNNTSSKLAKFLTYIGTIIIFMGILIISSLNWALLGGFGQVLITLGVGILLFIAATSVMVLKKESMTFLANSLYFIAGFLLPTGIFVLLDQFEPSSIDTSLIALNVFLILTFLYSITQFVFKKGASLYLITGFGSLSYLAFISYIATNFSFINSLFISISILLYALGLFCIGTIVYKSKYKLYYSFLEAVTTVLLPISIYMTGYFSIENIFGYNFLYRTSLVYDILFLFISLPMFYLGSRLNSRVINFLSAVFVVVWLIYLNSRYFAGQTSFGINLITSGIIIIGASLLFLYFKNRKNK